MSARPLRSGAARAAAAAVAGGLLAAAAPAAAQDAGVTSVFAHGAGNRALALGGAYAAIADDASAPLWNPAGLGLLQRSEIQATSATLYGLDISEQYASFALPSWRWGTAAFGFRRFAVGGIEQRSDRNVLLSDDLTDSETELKLSFGRVVGEGWSVGGSVKAQRQSLAGFAGFGIGLDLGVMARPGVILGREDGWLDRFSLGMTLRNVVEPTVRLDQEPVPDPAALRTGIAFRQPYRLGGLGDGYVLAAVDLVKTRGMGADAHAGMEVVPHPLLALRLGYGEDGLTAGTGVRWHLYSFDYSMEDNRFDTVHRLGLTMQFGATVTERRLAAQRREEEAFRERLAATFREREAERVRELLGEARTLLAEGLVDDALERLATVAALAPDDPGRRRLEVQALLAKASERATAGELADAAVLYGRVLALAPNDHEAQDGLERCRRESDLRAARTEQIRALFADALDAFTAGELTTARDGFREILGLAPDDTEAQDMLARTESAIRARTSDLLAQASRFLDRGLLDEAAGLVERARKLDPYGKGLAQLVDRLERTRRDRRAAERARELALADATKHETVVAPEGPVLSKKQRKEIADLYERGVEAMGDNRPDDAIRYWELVWTADPAFQGVADFLKREYLLRGLESFSKGRLEEAVGLWEKALKVDPSDEKTLGYLQRAREQQMRTREILGSSGGG